MFPSTMKFFLCCPERIAMVICCKHVCDKFRESGLFKRTNRERSKSWWIKMFLTGSYCIFLYVSESCPQAHCLRVLEVGFYIA